MEIEAKLILKCHSGEGDQPEIVDVWMEKATAINKVCKDFFTVS